VSAPEPKAVFPLERLLPFAIVASAGILFASNLMTTFEFVPPGGEALADQSAVDIHSYSPAVLAVCAVGAMIAAIATGSKPAATAVAACGVIALLLFLLVVLPDANQIGVLDDPRQSFFEAEAIPQTGFWLELIGALGLALSGAALATLNSEQIASLRPGRGREPKRPDERPRPLRGAAVIDQAEALGDEVREPADAKANPRTGAKSEPG
jgi:hypothetical protein